VQPGRTPGPSSQEAARPISILFGSVAQGRATGGSGIDILIVSDRLPASWKERGELAARLEEEAGLPLYHHLEIHMTTPQEAQRNPIYHQALREGIPIQPPSLKEKKSLGKGGELG